MSDYAIARRGTEERIEEKESGSWTQLTKKSGNS
jgi:hypothetical protein